MVKVFKEFVDQPDGKVLLMLHTNDSPSPRAVEGIDFAGVPEETRKFFLEREGRLIDDYCTKHETDNYSSTIASRNDADYGEKVREEIKFWEKYGIILL
jgi:hypothetical protein